MTIQAEFHPAAVEEAIAAREWYDARSPTAAEAFTAELERAVNQIVEYPDRWSKYLHGTRRYLFRRFPFFLIYRHTESSIVVIQGDGGYFLR
jgi:plasmid stabilization system protein ParE